jgi:hypothetical protein
MHQDKHAQLAKAGLLGALQRAAVRFGVSVDEVMHAGKGRSVRGEAKSAFAALDPDQRKAAQALSWPWTCPGCGALADELVTCQTCPTKGCAACQVPGKCSACRRGEAEQKVHGDRKQDERRRAEALRDRGAQEAAAAGEKIRARKDAEAKAEEERRAAEAEAVRARQAQEEQEAAEAPKGAPAPAGPKPKKR